MLFFASSTTHLLSIRAQLELWKSICDQLCTSKFYKSLNHVNAPFRSMCIQMEQFQYFYSDFSSFHRNKFTPRKINSSTFPPHNFCNSAALKVRSEHTQTFTARKQNSSATHLHWKRGQILSPWRHASWMHLVHIPFDAKEWQQETCAKEQSAA